MTAETHATILIVDDVPANLALLRQHLNKHDFRVWVAESGESALEQLQHALPDLILLDVKMPGMDGFEVCQHLKADPRTQDIPVIFLTAVADTEMKVRSFEVGSADYVTKPFEEVEVLARLNTHLAMRQLQQRLHDHNAQLEVQIQARTVQLQQTNATLQDEIERRKRYQQEKDKLFALVHKQSDQIRELSSWLIDVQQKQRSALAEDLRIQVEQNLVQIDLQFDYLRHTLSNDFVSDVALLQRFEDIHATLAQTQTYLGNVTNDLQQSTAELDYARDSVLIKLSAREREVLKLLVEGNSSAQIGELLNIADVTVRTYRQRIMQKLDIHNLLDLFKFALKHQLTTIE